MKKTFMSKICRNTISLLIAYTGTYFTSAAQQENSGTNPVILQESPVRADQGSDLSVKALEVPVKVKKGSLGKVNPKIVTDTISVLPAAYKVPLKIEVIDKSNKRFVKHRVRKDETEEIRLLMDKLTPGVYFVRITYKNEEVSELIKIVKQ